MFLKISQVSQESLFNKVTVLRAATLLKKTPTQVLSCEICRIFKNNYFDEICELLRRNVFNKRLQLRCFPVNLMNCPRTSILKSTYKQLVLKHRCRCFPVIKSRPGGLQHYYKETLAEVFYCEFCASFKKAFLQNTS